ncbi:MAG: type II secretion system minor pseudopilin GspH [Acidiferrobacterales bacterium]
MKSVDNRGFTLIELLVVMLLMVIVLAMVGLGMGSGESRALENEADRMALLLQSARQESILQGKVFAVAFTAGGYQFLALDNQTGKFGPIRADDMFRARKLPAAIRIRSVEIDGSAQGSKPRLILLPTGELPTFSIILAHGASIWSVEGTPDGDIKTAQPHA